MILRRQFVGRWRTLLQSMDWRFIRGSSLISIGIAAARIVGFAFSFLLARALTTDDFGFVQYALTLANVVTIATIPFAQHVLPYFISRYQKEADRLQTVLNTGWTLFVLLSAGTLLVAVPALALIGRLHMGVLVVATGSSAFALYSGLARGFISSGRILFMYLCSNVLQLVAVLWAVWVFGEQSVTPALIIYGLSYIVPIMILLTARPFPVRFRLTNLNRDTAGEMLRFAVPNWGSHTLFALFFAMDILLLEQFHDEATVGVYGLTRTIVLVFSFFPQGITMILMPKVAAPDVIGHRRLLINSLIVTLLVSVIALIGYLVVYEWFIVTFIGAAYFAGLPFALLMALSAIIFGLHAIVTSFLVGRNLPGLETISRVVILVVTIIVGLALIPPYSLLGAALASVLSAAAGIGVYPVLIYVRRRRSRGAANGHV